MHLEIKRDIYDKNLKKVVSPIVLSDKKKRWYVALDARSFGKYSLLEGIALAMEELNAKR